MGQYNHPPPSAFRFDPLDLALPLELEWVMTRAFGPRDAPLDYRPDPEQALRAARHLQLSSRIAQQVGGCALEAQLDRKVASQFTSDQRTAARNSALLLELAHRVSARAQEVAVPILFLGRVALVEGGIAALGARCQTEVEVLLPKEAEAKLVGALSTIELSRPTFQSRTPGTTLAHPVLGTVRLSTRLHGVRLRDGGEATIQDIIDAKKYNRMSTLPTAYLPSVVILAAQAIATSLGPRQAARTSALLETVSDLLDLGKKTGSLDGILKAATPLVRHATSERELHALQDLLTGLSEDRGWQRGDAGTMTRHALAPWVRRSGHRARRASSFLHAVGGNWRRLRRQLKQSKVGRIVLRETTTLHRQ